MMTACVGRGRDRVAAVRARLSRRAVSRPLAARKLIVGRGRARKLRQLRCCSCRPLLPRLARAAPRTYD